jgi:predicted DNA binding CopG/RHH family protein
MPKLSRDEKELVDAFEKGELKPVKTKVAETKRYREFARATFLKDKRVNIRISTKDLDGVRKKAVEEGIPYQTLISSIIHKFVDDRLVEKKC